MAAIQKFEQLAAVSIPATSTLTEVYLCPVGRKADVNISIANSADTATNIALVHIKNDTIANVAAADYLIGGAGVGLPTSALAHNLAPIEKTGLAMSEGDRIGVWTNNSALAVQVNGLEEDV